MPEKNDVTEEKQQKKPKKHMPRPGDLIYINIRSRIIDVGAEMSQVEIEELAEYGIVDRPIYMWVPTGMIEQEVIPMQSVEFSDKEAKNLPDMPELAADLHKT